jgi:hypothetical protein
MGSQASEDSTHVVQRGCGVHYDSLPGTGLLRSALVPLVVRWHVARAVVCRMSRDRQWECQR